MMPNPDKSIWNLRTWSFDARFPPMWKGELSLFKYRTFCKIFALKLPVEWAYRRHSKISLAFVYFAANARDAGPILDPSPPRHIGVVQSEGEIELFSQSLQHVILSIQTEINNLIEKWKDIESIPDLICQLLLPWIIDSRLHDARSNTPGTCLESLRFEPLSGLLIKGIIGAREDGVGGHNQMAAI